MTAPLQLASTPLDGDIVLLEASAGTGKTYALTGIVLRLLLERRVESIDRILLVTFTIAATDELKTRLRQAIRLGIAACDGAPTEDPFLRQLGRQHGEAGATMLRAALREFDTMAIATIHGFCKRLLDDAAFESGAPFESDFVDDEIPLLRQAAQDAVRQVLYPRGTAAAAVARTHKLEPEVLVADFQKWQRCPDTELVPPAGPLDAALARVAPALAAVAAAFDAADLSLLLPDLQLRKGTRYPWDGDAPAFVALLYARVADDPALALPWLLDLAPSRLARNLLQKQLGKLQSRPFFQACDALASACDDAGLSLRTELLQAMQTRLQRHKQRHSVLTFHDLLQQVQAALRHRDTQKQLLAAVQQRWQVALIDEFQDTDPLQCDIFFDCFRHRQLFLVGDPKQAIYGFRGADVAAYLHARSTADRHYTLGQNWRSHPQLIAGIEHLFARALPFVDPGIDMPHVTAAWSAAERGIDGLPGAPLQLRFCPPKPGQNGARALHNNGQLEPRIIADVTAECVRLLSADARIDKQPLRPRHIAILTRTNAQAMAIQGELRSHGVHSAIGKAGDIFLSAEMVEIERLLLAVAAPTNLRLLRAAMATVLWGQGSQELARLEADDAAMSHLLEQVEDWRRIWLQRGFVVMFERLQLDLSLRPRLLQRPDGERRLTNYLQVVELLHGAEHQNHLTPEGLLQWLQHERQHRDEIDYQRRELRLESDADAVQILTVHGSKGLEYEIVFCPFLWHSHLLRDARVLVRNQQGTGYVYDCGSDAATHTAHRLQAQKEQLAEDLRLCYVALTRARRRLYLYHAAGTNSPQSALAWLLHHQQKDHRDDWDADVRKRVHAWSGDLQGLVQQSGGSIAMQTVEPEPHATPLLAAATPATLLPPRAMPRRQLRPWSITSFTALAAGARTAVELRDHAEPDAAAAAPAAGIASGMAAFARGAAAGVCLHEMLEQFDFAAADAGRASALATTVLRRHGLLAATAHRSPLEPVAAVATMLQHLAAAAWPDGGLRLCDIAAADRSVEWQFFLSSSDGRPQQLAALLQQHGDAELQSYGAQLRRLSGAQLSGFLRGFVDLVARHQRRYYLFDWKSNWLGNDVGDYAAANLHHAMRAHDYVLQYLLYALALHRHLQQRQPDYDYDRHFGGIGYAFLRGVRPGSDTGLYFRRPPWALIAALDGFFGGRSSR